jgi:hypothetical protein
MNLNHVELFQHVDWRQVQVLKLATHLCCDVIVTRKSWHTRRQNNWHTIIYWNWTSFDACDCVCWDDNVEATCKLNSCFTTNVDIEDLEHIHL